MRWSSLLNVKYTEKKKKKRHYVKLYAVILLFKKGRELGTFYYTRIFMWFTISVQKVCVRDISL